MVIYKKERRNKWVHLCGYAVFITLLSCGTTKSIKSSEIRETEWELVKKEKVDHPSWVIYSRKIVGTSFQEYKIEGDIASPASTCLNSFKQDIYDEANSPNNKKYPKYEIVRESKNSLSTYVIHNEPFPLNDTEMSVRYDFTSESDGSAGVKWKEDWSENTITPSKKLNRVETFRGSWNFTQTSPNSCKAVNILKFDPKKMPKWLVQPMVVKFLKNGLKDIRERSRNN